MSKMKNFMVVHQDPQVSWEKVEENWSRMVDLETATWLRTYYNVDEKVRYCLWRAPDKETLETIFADFKISWESIMDVKETIPDIWAREYQAQMEAEEKREIAESREM